MEYNLEVEKLTKKYQDFKLNNVNILLPKGKILGFVGVNGSGKTTTIKAILDLIKVDNGVVKIFGKNNKKLTKLDKENIGVVLDDSFFTHVLNIDDINELMKNFYSTWDEKLFYKYIKKFKIPKDKVLKDFSSGMKMKIKIICAISHKSKLLILDEPTNGLDPVFRYEILDIFNDYVKNGENSIFISSHITTDLDYIADEIIFINDGKILLNITKKEFKEDFGILECLPEDFNKYDIKDYERYLKYKNAYLLFTTNKKEFKKKYPTSEIKSASIEEVMLMFIKGVKV